MKQSLADGKMRISSQTCYLLFRGLNAKDRAFTHINTEESHLVPLTCQLEAAKQMALMREAGIIQYSTLLTFTCGAARQPLIQPSLDYSHTAQRREGASDRSGDGGMLGKARRLINVTLVYSDRGL